MFRNLDDFLAGRASLETDSEGNPTSRELQVAMVAVLAEAARADKEFNSLELSRIMGTCLREFGVSEESGAELLEIAEFLDREPEKREHFIQALNSNLNDDQRSYLLGLVWRVLTADGQLENHENTFAASLRKKLNLTLEQAIRAQMLSKKHAGQDLLSIRPAIEPEE